MSSGSPTVIVLDIDRELDDSHLAAPSTGAGKDAFQPRNASRSNKAIASIIGAAVTSLTS